jgi:hypothetical protein
VAIVHLAVEDLKVFAFLSPVKHYFRFLFACPLGQTFSEERLYLTALHGGTSENYTVSP